MIDESELEYEYYSQMQDQEYYEEVMKQQVEIDKKKNKQRSRIAKINEQIDNIKTVLTDIGSCAREERDIERIPFWLDDVIEEICVLGDMALIAAEEADIYKRQTKELNEFLSTILNEKALIAHKLAKAEWDLVGKEIEIANKDKKLVKQQNAIKKRTASRIEAEFRREIFLPLFIEWKEGELNYKSQAEFFREMQKQFKILAKKNEWSKTSITERTLAKWIKETPDIQTATTKLRELKPN